ncbi:MAG TPA: transposase [Thermoanaerobaculia bacterium]|nr:transposase [Thermoanaerobaculia bacterium]
MPVGDDTYAYRRYLPHLQKQGKTYFVTFCTFERRVLTGDERTAILACCVRDHRVVYWLHCACVMPDHVHLVFTPFDDFTLAKIMNRVKGASAHAIGRRSWQREYFDRALRSDEDLRKKCEYVCENPVRAGLVASAGEYLWTWRQWVDDAPPRAAALH